jgi:hypothetical protein
MVELKLSLSLIGAAFKFVQQPFCALWNFLSRPKANIDFRNHNIVVKDNDGVEHHINYPCLFVWFNQNQKLDLKKIKLNNESLQGLVSSDQYFLRQNSSGQNRVEIMGCEVYKYFNDTSKVQILVEVPAFEVLIIPLCLEKGKSNLIFNAKKNSKLLFPSKKFTLTLNINGKDYEYGIGLVSFCKVVVNNLAFK